MPVAFFHQQKKKALGAFFFFAGDRTAFAQASETLVPSGKSRFNRLFEAKNIAYTEMNSKIGILARSRRRFWCLERATIVDRQGASEDPKYAAKTTQSKKPIFDFFSVLHFSHLRKPINWLSSPAKKKESLEAFLLFFAGDRTPFARASETLVPSGKSRFRRFFDAKNIASHFEYGRKPINWLSSPTKKKRKSREAFSLCFLQAIGRNQNF
ncbi:MAG TPA: hypothetical protein VLE96_01845 [Chlamydiales bacterium]|nr:hypothetical protein [Chlamydiales bacterium]